MIVNVPSGEIELVFPVPSIRRSSAPTCSVAPPAPVIVSTPHVAVADVISTR